MSRFIKAWLVNNLDQNMIYLVHSQQATLRVQNVPQAAIVPTCQSLHFGLVYNYRCPEQPISVKSGLCICHLTKHNCQTSLQLSISIKCNCNFIQCTLDAIPGCSMAWRHLFKGAPCKAVPRGSKYLLLFAIKMVTQPFWAEIKKLRTHYCALYKFVSFSSTNTIVSDLERYDIELPEYVKM